jgi:nucleoside diphosphate kinase
LIARFEDKGLNIVAMKLMQVDKKLAAEHYAEHVKKPFYPSLEAFITGGPIVAMVLEGIEAIQVVRDMLGATSGLKAAPGTIRGDYSGSRQMNLVHAARLAAQPAQVGEDRLSGVSRRHGLHAGRRRQERGAGGNFRALPLSDP